MDLTKLEPIPVVCSQSKLACALACKRKWWCKYRMGIELRGTERKDAATLGTIYHRLQCLGPGSEMTVMAEVQKQQTALMDRVNKGEDLDGNTARQAGMLTELYNKAVAMSQIFWERFPQPLYFETQWVETKLQVHFQSWPFLFEGTVDKILRDTSTTENSVWIRDHKSTGRSLESIFGGIAWSLQARIYRILVSPGYGVIRGFILDGITTPGIKLCKTDEKHAKEWNVPLPDAYLRRVKEWYAEKPDDHIRSRGIIYTEPMWSEELVYACNVLRNLQGRRGVIPAYFDRDVTRRECFAYEKQCVYHELCETDPKNWDALFETRYRFADRKEIENGEEKHEEINEDGTK